jgi:riboflavin transporter FmnP
MGVFDGWLMNKMNLPADQSYEVNFHLRGRRPRDEFERSRIERIFMKSLSTRTIALSAALATVSAITQLIHLGYQSPQWGMWIDVVAVSWIIAYFLFGVRSSLLVSLMGALIITLFAPDTWLGAIMKWTATMPIWLTLFLWNYIRKQKLLDNSRFLNLIPPLSIGLIIRSLIIVPLNYYIAIPIWTGMTTEVAFKTIPWLIIVVFNSIQGVIDLALAWLITYKFKLRRFGEKAEEKI